MTKKEIARSGAATPTRAGSNAMAGRIEHDDCNTVRTAAQGAEYSFLSAILKHGAENAIPGPALAAMLGISDTRSVRQLIENARRGGEVILSTANGYYLPAIDPEVAKSEILRFVHAQGERLRTNRATIASAKLALAQIEMRDQLAIGEDAWDDQL